MCRQRPYHTTPPDIPKNDSLVPSCCGEEVSFCVEGETQHVRGMGCEGAERDSLRAKKEQRDIMFNERTLDELVKAVWRRAT